MHQWNAYDSGSVHVQTVLLRCVASPNSPGSTVSTLFGSIHQTKGATQSLVFFIVCHPLSVNVHILNALSVIENSTKEWYVNYRLVW